MASSFQQQSLQRKLIYFGLILVLFTLTTFGWRGVESLGQTPDWTLTAQARRLKLLEQHRGKTELAGEAVRLSLFGSRGWVATGLWVYAIEAQKKNQLTELDLYVQSLTSLQPHYIGPWQFQSWNLSYNVSVECDRIRDKYYFMARGIQLLAEGEEKNRNHPDLRFYLGFYYQHKIMQSDETMTLRSLFQMSCIDPDERNPKKWDDMEGGRAAQFRQFCEKNPQLVRRLREKLEKDKDEKIMDFLQENHNVPALYEYELRPGEKKLQVVLDPVKRFPVLPPPPTPGVQDSPRPIPWPQEIYDANELTSKDPEKLSDKYGFDAFAASRAWYAYAQEPLPPPAAMPGDTAKATDRAVQRKPKNMATVIFRTYPARAQSYVAERLEAEGWFDRTWPIAIRDPADSKKSIALQVGWEDLTREQWHKAEEMWKETGRKNGLWLPPDEKEKREKKAKDYVQSVAVEEGELPATRSRDDLPEEQRDLKDAYDFLYWHQHYRRLTNFAHHHNRASICKIPEGMRARRYFYEADQLRRVFHRQAAEKYDAPQKDLDGKSALQTWAEILKTNRDFSRDTLIQEEAYEIQLKYLGALRKARTDRLMSFLNLHEVALGRLTSQPAGVPGWTPLVLLGRRDEVLPRLEFVGPFDIKDDAGQPLISPEARETVNARRNIGPRQVQPADLTPAQPQAGGP